MRTNRPLSPLTYLLRNAGKTIPLTAVITLAVMLVSGIIAMITSSPYSIRTTYDYSREMVGITPRGDTSKTQSILNEVRQQSPIPIDRIIICRTANTQIHSIVGKWPFYVLGFEPDAMRYYLHRQLGDQFEGRLPNPGQPEAIISEPVARNLDLKIGSILLGPEKEESFSPRNVKVVGIAKTRRWLMLAPIDYSREYHFPPVDIGIVFAKNLEEQAKLDDWAIAHFKGRPVGVVAYKQILKNTDEMFTTLFAILNVVIATLVVVLTFMMGMLMNIYQTQRLVEFGLLQAIGYTKQRILSRVLMETIVVVVFGWILGVISAFGLLNLAKAVLMDPKAFELDVFDKVAFRYTLPLPVMILLTATVTSIIRFRNFDPVGIVERRLV